MRCTNCDTRLDGDDHFIYRRTDAHLCWECTGAVVSWMLDGGTVDHPDTFSDLVGQASS